MNRGFTDRLGAIAVLLLVAATPVSSAAQEGEADGGVASDAFSSDDGDFEDDGELELIVVTARKRREFLQDTPVSVSVLGGDMLERQGVDSLEQAGLYVPNLTSFSGVQRQGTYYSRGVGQRDAVPTLDPGVGIYVDDVYIARAQGSLLPLVDIERVEVLRGPQGTLYGKNTIGGAVKIITRKPGAEPELVGRVTGGSFGLFDVRASANLPIVDDELYSRFTFTGRVRDGYTENQFDGEKFNDDSLYGLRGQLRYLPHKDVTVDLAGHFSRESERGKGAKCRQSDPSLAAAFPPPGLGLHDRCLAIQAMDEFDFASNLSDRYRLDSYGASMTGDWEMGPVALLDDLNLKSVTSWREQVVDEGFLDIDATDIVLGPPLFLPYQTELRTLEDQRQWQVSQELQAIATTLDDTLKLTAGLYGFWEETEDGDILNNAFQTLRQDRVEIDNDSYAVYGQASWSPIDLVELTGGIRWTYEDKSAHRTIVFGADPGELPSERASKSFDKWTPMGSVAFRAPASLFEGTPLGHGILYFTYSEGWKSGGFSTRRDPTNLRIGEFDQEDVTNYEVGIKLEAFDNRLVVNAAFFYMEYEDIQLTVQRAIDGPVAFQPVLGSSIANAGEATISGFELEAVARPLDDLTIRGAVGLTDAEYDEFADQTFTFDGVGDLVTLPIDRSDEPFFNIPKWNVDGSIDYVFDLDRIGLPGWGSVTPLVHVYWQSRTYLHLTAEGHASRKFTQSDYALVDARITWDLGDDRTSIALFGNNLTDEAYYANALDLTNTLGLGAVYYAAPRTFGGSITYRWNAADLAF
jgi:iron complex outermembrane receptor protein